MESANDLLSLQKQLHDVKVQKASIKSAMRRKERHSNRLESLAAARKESAVKLAAAPTQALAPSARAQEEEDDDVDWDAAIEELQRKEQYLKSMDEAMWTGPPPWSDPTVWYDTSGMQWHYTLDKDHELVVASHTVLNLKILAKPFAHGSSHLAYFALDASGRKLVAKRQLYEPASARSGVRDLQTYVHGHTTTCQLVEAYKEHERLHGNIDIEPVTLVVVKASGLRQTPFEGSTQVVLLLETWLEGRFQKWVTNTGGIMERDPAVEAFAHFSHEHFKSEGRPGMVLDLQGVRGCDGNYHLTDPAVTSAGSTRIFGPTDMGPTAIATFLEQHTCTAGLCPKNTDI